MPETIETNKTAPPPLLVDNPREDMTPEHREFLKQLGEYEAMIDENHAQWWACKQDDKRSKIARRRFRIANCFLAHGFDPATRMPTNTRTPRFALEAVNPPELVKSDGLPETESLHYSCEHFLAMFEKADAPDFVTPKKNKTKPKSLTI